MKVCRNISEFRKVRAAFGPEASLGLVPTMGALHGGHMALVAAAKADNARVAATIFVNPTQFGEAADLENYPRTEAEDLKQLQATGVDAVLIPDAAEIYPDGAETIVETTRLANMLHGLVRPGHYRGVATVVTKLFNITQPDRAYFGEKDYQQLAVIRAMVRDLHTPIDIIGVPTQRDPDGLATSSRNVRLSADDRAAAPILNKALDAAMTQRTAETIAATIKDIVGCEPRARLKGLDIVDAATFAPVTGPLTAKTGVMISAEFGPADDPILLIDQREITP
ncbi:MAG: pantoate--beta-alanine ligase [Pseudomonadota bacterium]